MPSVNKCLAAVCSKSWPGWPEWVNPFLGGLEQTVRLFYMPKEGWQLQTKTCYGGWSLGNPVATFIAHAICEKWLREKLAEKKAYILPHPDGWWFAERYLGKPDYDSEVLTRQGWWRWTDARGPIWFTTYVDAAVAAVEACQKESKP